VAHQDERVAITAGEATGPVTGAIAKADLRDPRVRVEVALTDSRIAVRRPNVGRLTTTSHAVDRLGYDLDINGSFFAVTQTKEHEGKKVSYFAGNPTHPVGWRVNRGKVITRPKEIAMRETMVIDDKAEYLSTHSSASSRHVQRTR
jgi:hypothetical protein